MFEYCFTSVRIESRIQYLFFCLIAQEGVCIGECVAAFSDCHYEFCCILDAIVNKIHIMSVGIENVHEKSCVQYPAQQSSMHEVVSQ